MSFKTFLYSFNHNIALLFMRASFGILLFWAHGLPKLQRFPSSGFPDPLGVGSTVSMGLAIFAEVVCALLLALGLWTRLALIPLITTMFVIVFILHSGDPLRDRELALMFLIGFIGLFISGPGRYSVDARMK